MIITVRSIARPVDVDTFADITAKEVTSLQWIEDGLAIGFAVNLSADEVRLVRMRAASPDDATEQLLRQAWTAFQNNADFLALPAPSTAQALAQVAALTRQMQAIVRLLAPVD